MYALHSLYSPPGRLQRSGLIVKYSLTSIHTIHTFLPCASSHPSLIRASPHPPIYLGCACPFQQRAFCPPDTNLDIKSNCLHCMIPSSDRSVNDSCTHLSLNLALKSLIQQLQY